MKGSTIEFRHHDMVNDSHFEVLRKLIPTQKIETRLLREEEIYEEGVLPPMLTLSCSVQAFFLINSAAPFIDSLSQLIDGLRAIKEPGFYSGSDFTAAPSLAVFMLLDSGEKLKLYIKEKEGFVCKEAIYAVPLFLDQYDLSQLKAKTSLGLIAMYKHDVKNWQPVGF